MSSVYNMDFFFSPGVCGRGQHECPGGAVSSWRLWWRCVSPEPPQDLLHPSWWRRTGHGPHWSVSGRGGGGRRYPEISYFHLFSFPRSSMLLLVVVVFSCFFFVCVSTSPLVCLSVCVSGCLLSYCLGCLSVSVCLPISCLFVCLSVCMFA